MFDYASIDWSKALEPERLAFLDLSKSEKRVRLAGAFRELLFRRSVVADRGNGNEVLFLKSIYRRDYNQLFDQIYSCCGGHKTMVDLRVSKDHKLSLRGLWIAVRYLPILFLVRAESLQVWLYLQIRAVRAMEWYHLLRKYNYSAIVVFADMWMVDNIMVQVSNLRGKKTITLQHGLYIDYADHFNVNIVNYKNVVSQEFLAWGNDTKKLINNHHPEVEVTICGKPLEPKDIVNARSDYFTVIFDQNLFLEYNKKLLDIAYKFAEKSGLRINLRLHPKNKLAWFDIDESVTLMDADVFNSKFVVGHTSSLMYECLRLGMLSFKFTSQIPSIEMPDELSFCDAESLMTCYQQSRFPHCDNQVTGRIYLEHIGEESMDRYRDYFRLLLRNLRKDLGVPSSLENGRNT